jgi:uncharacterized DUF497 family protein
MTDRDTSKARRNREVHGIDFRDAAAVFDDAMLVVPDRRKDRREDRWVAIGRVGPAFLFVAYTIRQGRIRLISARKASSDEKRLWEAAFGRLAPRYIGGDP